MKNGPTATHFLNVDLDIHSKDDLQPLAQAFGKKVDVLWVGRAKRTHYAHFELASRSTTPDNTIRALCRLINARPKAERGLWNAAKRRDFSVGVQSVAGSPVIDFAIKPEILRLASDLGARIVFTVYSPNRPNDERSE